MPDRRRHRGRHPADTVLFGAEYLEALRTATLELSWLLERGYAEVSALKIVGDRHELRERQRTAVRRCACGESARADRASRRIPLESLAGRDLAVDGFNCLITSEAAFAGGVVLRGRDDCHRDLASVHGSYRRVEETRQAIAGIGEVLARYGPTHVRWYLDRPVSNSGRLRMLLLEQAEAAGWPWEVDLVNNPDRCLVEPEDRDRVAASCDSWVLDHCGPWIDLQGAVIRSRVTDAWIVDLSRE